MGKARPTDPHLEELQAAHPSFGWRRHHGSRTYFGRGALGWVIVELSGDRPTRYTVSWRHGQETVPASSPLEAMEAVYVDQ